MKRYLNMPELFLIGIVSNLFFGLLLPVFLNPETVLSYYDILWFPSFVSFLLSTSLLGKKIQLPSYFIFVFTSGIRSFFLEPAISYVSTNNLEPNVYLCIGSLMLWLAWLIVEGRKYTVDADEWVLTVTTILYLIIGTILTNWILYL